MSGYRPAEQIAAELLAKRDPRDAELTRLRAELAAAREAWARLDRLRDAVVEAAEWHEAQDDALSKQPPSGDRAWRRAEHQEQAAKMRAELAALDAQPAPRATAETVRVAVWDWQPIVTAPRDGTRFIAWWPPSPRFPAGMWHECQWYNGAWYHPFYTDPSHWQSAPTDGPQSQEPGHE